MKRIPLIFFGLILVSNQLFSQYSLGIEITSIRNDKGKIMLQLFDDKEKVLVQEMGTIRDNKSIFTLKNLKPGKYAIRYYHDENMNMKMETNFVGKPTEGYGFSNNVVGKFGPPPFEKWLFELKEDKKVVLNINY
jgi:uncharacterized protein (DUF2141 family)